MLITLLVVACHPTRGCTESSFTLSPESRIPKWFATKGIPRTAVEVTMDYWGGLGSGRTATFSLRDLHGLTIASAVGTLQGKEPLTLEPHGETGRIPYPLYEIITVDGVAEVIEHRRMEPIFFITDDPIVKAKLGIK